MIDILHQLEKKLDSLEFTKSKLLYPQTFPIEDVENELLILTEETEDLKLRVSKINIIAVPQDLMIRQLTEYINILKKDTNYPFSSSQGLKFEHYFYVKPVMDIKNILFNDLKGIFGVNLNLTLNELDYVRNKEEFKNLLKDKRDKLLKAKNMFDLYEVYSNLFIEIKRDFC